MFHVAQLRSHVLFHSHVLPLFIFVVFILFTHFSVFFNINFLFSFCFFILSLVLLLPLLLFIWLFWYECVVLRCALLFFFFFRSFVATQFVRFDFWCSVDVGAQVRFSLLNWTQIEFDAYATQRFSGWGTKSNERCKMIFFKKEQKRKEKRNQFTVRIDHQIIKRNISSHHWNDRLHLQLHLCKLQRMFLLLV